MKLDKEARLLVMGLIDSIEMYERERESPAPDFTMRNLLYTDVLARKDAVKVAIR